MSERTVNCARCGRVYCVDGDSATCPHTCSHKSCIADLEAANARLQDSGRLAEEAMGHASAALSERTREVDLLKRERDRYKALAERLQGRIDEEVKAGRIL